MASDGVPCPGFHVGVRNQVACHLAGELADGVGPHAVGDDEDMPALPPGLRDGMPGRPCSCLDCSSDACPCPSRLRR